MTTTPFSLLVTAAIDANFPTERLVRAAQILAGAVQDDEVREWCSQELAGYTKAPLPGYRNAAAMFMATDSHGREVPVDLHDLPAESRARFGTCNLNAPLAEIAQCAGAPENGSFKVLFSPKSEEKLLKVVSGARGVFQVVQKSAFSGALAGARHRVFEWAVSRIHEVPALPAGLDMRALLGLPNGATADPLAAVGRAAVDLSNAHLSGPVQIVMHSPGANTTQTAFGANLAALKELVETLSEAAKKANATDSSGVQLQEALSELRALVAMPQPRQGWIKESFKTVRTVLEGATGALIAELSKPQVQTILAHAASAWG